MLTIRPSSSQRRFRNIADEDVSIELKRREDAVQQDYLQAQSLISDVMMSGLKSVDLSHLSNLIELPNSISRCDSLQEINVSNTSIYDLSVVSNLKSLKKVCAYFTPLLNIDFVHSLTNVEWLCASATNIKDISPVRALRNLKYIDISHTNVSDISPLGGCESLSEVILRDTNISSVEGLSKLNKIKILDVSKNNSLIFDPSLWQGVDVVIY